MNETIRKEMKFILVDDVKSVFKAALLQNKPSKIVRGPRRLRKGAEAAYMLGHLCADDDPTKSHGWLGVGQLLERTVTQIIKLATHGRLN